MPRGKFKPRLHDLMLKAEDCYDPADYTLVHNDLLAELRRELEGIWSDHCLYPQLRLPENQARRVLALHQRFVKASSAGAVDPQDGITPVRPRA